MYFSRAKDRPGLAPGFTMQGEGPLRPGSVVVIGPIGVRSQGHDVHLTVRSVGEMWGWGNCVVEGMHWTVLGL